MKVDKFKLIFLSTLLSILLFITLIVSNKISNITLALILSLFAILFTTILKKKKILSTSKSQANLILIGCGILYVAIYYLTGIIINKFLKSPTPFGIKTLLRYIVPLIVIVISSELIRMRLLSQEVKLNLLKFKINCSEFFAFLISVLIDLVLYTRMYNINNLDDFLIIIGFVLFSSLSCNIFFNYIAKRYGISGIIIYRLITSLYIYIIPIIPDIYIFFKTFFRMLFPFIMYLIIEGTYAKTSLVTSKKVKQQNILSITITILLMLVVIMLISCKFTYGILVIGSGSMTGTIDKGDAVVFKKYKNQEISKGQIIVFKKNGVTLIHRVIDKRNINGEIRYYTKGDANKMMDSGYILSKDITGCVNFKIKYIGYPTIWVNEIFS